MPRRAVERIGRGRAAAADSEGRGRTRREPPAREPDDQIEDDEPEIDENDPPRRRESSEDRDRQVMNGHPADGGFQFRYGERTFESPEDLQSYIQELEKRPAEPTRETRRPSQADQQQSTERQPTQQQPPAQPKRAGDDIDWDKEFFTDPKAAMAKFRDGIQQEVRTQVVQEYQQDQAIRRFWTDFYNEHKDMVGKEFLVNSVFQRDFEELGSMKTSEARKELADRTRETIVTMGGGQRREGGQQQRTTVEGGASTSTNRRERSGGGADQEAKPVSLSGLIKRRQNARRSARTATA